MNKNLSILLVQTSAKDSNKIADRLQMPGFIEEIIVLQNLQSVASFLNKENRYAGAKTPDLIIIDWNELNAIDILKFLKDHPKFKAIPVIVLSDSLEENIVKACYQNRANCLIAKPVNYKEFSEVIESIKDFWINIAELPIIKDE